MNEPLNPRAPAFQWYPADFMADLNVQLMDWAQRGIYVWLINICWLEKSIPSDIGSLAKLTHTTVGYWEEFGAQILKCFKSNNNGRLIHPRIEKEREKQQAYREIKQRSGEIGAKKRWHKTSNINNINSNATILPLAKNSSSIFYLLSSSSDTPPKSPSRGNIALSSSNDDSAQNVFTVLPICGNDNSVGITKSYLDEMRKLYPGVDVEKETLRAKGWLISNPKRQKTKSGIGRFLNNWYSKAQNSHKTFGAVSHDILDDMLEQAEREENAKRGSH